MTNLPPRGTKRLCHGDTHVYLVGAAYCTCGGQVNVPPLQMIYGYPAHYKPPGTAPKPQTAEDVPLGRFQAARRAGASHLSPDGTKAFVIRFGECHQTNWDGNEWGSWWAMGGSIVPPDAVAIE